MSRSIPEFGIGDTVQVTWPGWSGDGEVVAVNLNEYTRLYIYSIEMETGDMRGYTGGFYAAALTRIHE